MSPFAAASLAFGLFASCGLAADKSVQPVPETDDWTVDEQSEAASVDPDEIARSVFADLADVAGISNDLPVFLRRDDQMRPEDNPKGLTGLDIRCEPAPDYGFSLVGGGAPALANTCKLDASEDFSIIAYSPAIFDLAQPCLDKEGKHIARIDSLRWILAHEVSHIANHDPTKLKETQVPMCRAFLQSPDPQFIKLRERTCDQLSGCRDWVNYLIAHPEDKERPDVQRKLTYLERDLCKKAYEKEFAAMSRDVEQQADLSAVILMRDLRKRRPEIDYDERAGQCVLSRLRDLEEVGWFGPPLPAELMDHPPTAVRYERQEDAIRR
jgi:hypothetical protein